LRIEVFKKTSWRTGTEPLVDSSVRGYVVSVVREFPMFDELWSEINDSQGEIFDVIDFKEEWEKEEKFDVEKHINGNTEF
jgi:c-di-GMP-related signal transduction protein